MLVTVWFASWLAALAATIFGLLIVPTEFDAGCWRVAHLADLARLPLVALRGVLAIVLVRQITKRLDTRARMEGLESA